MSFGLGRGRRLDVAPGVVGIERDEFGPLPDDLLANPRAGWVDVASLFGAPEHALEIEIGSGKGTFLVQQAALAPKTNFLGIEWAHEFYAYACDRVRRRGLTNIRLLNADATEFLHWRAPDHVASVIHLYFSDPWPKKKHHKKRVVQDRFLGDCARVLVPGGDLRIVTDHDDYWSWMQEHVARWTAPDPADPARPVFERLPFGRSESAGEDELVGTNFERKFRVEGRSFHACVLRSGPRRPDAAGRL